MAEKEVTVGTSGSKVPTRIRQDVSRTRSAGGRRMRLRLSATCVRSQLTTQAAWVSAKERRVVPSERKASRSDGFVMYPSAPRRAAAARSLGESDEVRITTGTWRN